MSAWHKIDPRGTEYFKNYANEERAMSSSKWSTKDTGILMGCAFAILRVAVCMPMYLILVFALMQANDMPIWAWVLYWAYVPTTCIVGFGQAIGEPLMKS